MTPFTILLAEDEAAVREGLTVLLESEGYAVRAVADGKAALAAFQEQPADLLLLDVMMPGFSGLAVCRQVRAQNASVPILFLTAKDGVTDELSGLASGADDYISKTAPTPVILARLAAALRRTADAVRPSAAEAASGGTSFAFGSWRVDGLNARLVAADGTFVPLTLREVELLRCLVEQPGEVFSRDYLLTRFWGLDATNENVLTVTLHRLREKLGPAGAALRTAHGKGYYYLP